MSLAVLAAIGCRAANKEIAVIPRTSATLLSESEHTGIARTAKQAGLTYYWNAPMRDDDVQAQLHLLETVLERRPAGIILSPDETLPFRSPVQQVLQRHIPAVIVGTDLRLPPSDYLAYVLNNEQDGASRAAHFLGELLHGHGSIAIVGIRHQLTTTSERYRIFEETLHRDFPGITVVYRSFASATFSEEQLSAEALLRSRSDIQAIVALTDAATRGAFLALQAGGLEGRVHLIGFDQDLIVPLATGGIDAIVMQDANTMGRDAVQLLADMIHGGKGPRNLTVSPVLVTRQNYKSAEVRAILDQRWYAQ